MYAYPEHPMGSLEHSMRSLARLDQVSSNDLLLLSTWIFSNFRDSRDILTTYQQLHVISKVCDFPIRGAAHIILNKMKKLSNLTSRKVYGFPCQLKDKITKCHLPENMKKDNISIRMDRNGDIERGFINWEYTNDQWLIVIRKFTHRWGRSLFFGIQ